MVRRGFQTVDEYIAGFPPAVQAVLETVRAVIRDVAPEATEGIAYQTPAYRLNGPMVYFGGFKNHYSLFGPGMPLVLEALGERLARYKTAKGTIRFPLSEPIPVELIRAVVEHRAALCRARVTDSARVRKRK